MVSSPNLADKSWVTAQYDRYVQGNTVLAQPDELRHGARRRGRPASGVAIATDGNGRYARLDPYAGAQLALAEAYRNVAATGAQPLAVTNCLNFGSPEDPEVMWQFAEAVRGLADGLPRAGGAGHRRQRELLQPDRRDGDPAHARSSGCWASSPRSRQRTPMAFGDAGRRGPPPRRDPRRARRDRSGRTSCTVTSAGLPPTVDLEAEHLLAEVLVDGARHQLLRAAHDLSEGGPRAGAGRDGASAGTSACRSRSAGDPFVALFSESTARAVVVVVTRMTRPALMSLAQSRGVPVARLGVVGGDAAGRGGTSSSIRGRRAPHGLGGHAARAVRPVCRLTPMARGKEVDLADARAALDAQWALLRSWVAALPPVQYAVPSVLAGWTVGDLVGHLSRTLLLFETLEPAPGRVTPLTIGGYVSAYAGVATRSVRAPSTRRPRSRAIRWGRSTVAGRPGALSSARFGRGEVMAAMRGPIRSGDLVATRVIECVVHADDLSQSLPDREPVALDTGALALVVRALLGVLAERYPGNAVEVRVPPFGVVQCIEGPRHTRGTPPNVVETPALTWVRLAAGRLAWAEGVHVGDVRASGERADLAGNLPLL